MSDSSLIKDKIIPLAQLMRLANVFTAVADVWMGFLIMENGWERFPFLVGLSICSCCLYIAGMILNDAADAQVDALERPERPIPSGKIGRRSAYLIGWGFLVAGMMTGLTISFVSGKNVTGLIVWALSVTILAYNAWMKHTLLGPLALGLCRSLNVLLGMSLWIVQMSPFTYLMVDVPLPPILGMGCYVCGIGWLAKEEHTTSRLVPLRIGVFFLLTGVAVFASAPWWHMALERVMVPNWIWIVVWSIVGGGLLMPIAAALRSPSPERVQSLVGISLLLIIPIDATLTWGYSDWRLALCVLALIVPAKVLSRWLKVT